MKFKFFGTEIYLSFLFCAQISLLIVFDRTGFFIPLLSAVIFHETGHLFMMWIRNCPPLKIRLVPAAVEITARTLSDFVTELAVAAAGPAVNFLFFAVFYLNYKISLDARAVYFAAANLVIGTYNLLPVKGLDGGSILFYIISKIRGEQFSEAVLKFTGRAVCLTVLIAVALGWHKGIINRFVILSAVYFTVISLIKSG